MLFDSFWLALAFAILVTFALALFSAVLIERPALKLKGTSPVWLLSRAVWQASGWFARLHWLPDRVGQAEDYTPQERSSGFEHAIGAGSPIGVARGELNELWQIRQFVLR